MTGTLQDGCEFRFRENSACICVDDYPLLGLTMCWVFLFGFAGIKFKSSFLIHHRAKTVLTNPKKWLLVFTPQSFGV